MAFAESILPPGSSSQVEDGGVMESSHPRFDFYFHVAPSPYFPRRQATAEYDTMRMLGDDTPSPAPAPPAVAPADSEGGGGGDEFPTPLVPTPTPTPKPEYTNNYTTGAAVALPFLILVLLFAFYRFYRSCQRKREQHLMNLRSAQADSVLGDMQMVPSEDPDAELL